MVPMTVYTWDPKYIHVSEKYSRKSIGLADRS